MTARSRGEPQRFRDLMRSARRDRDISRAAVAVLKADSLVGQALERGLGAAGLTLPQFNILMELAATPDGMLPLYELNKRLISTPPNTSFLTNKMEQAGLVTKSRDARDSRVVNLALAEQGWAALGAAAPLAFAAERELFDQFSRDDVRRLGDLLTQLLAQR